MNLYCCFQSHDHGVSDFFFMTHTPENHDSVLLFVLQIKKNHLLGRALKLPKEYLAIISRQVSVSSL